MASWQEVATGLKQALVSGNAQASESAIALYDETLGDDDELSVELGPIKRVLSPEEAASVSEVGGGTEQDQEDAAVNASDATPATTTVGSVDEETMDEKVEDLSTDVEADTYEGQRDEQSGASDEDAS